MKNISLPVPQKWRPWIILILPFLCYVNTLNHDYTVDDAIVISDNMFTQQGIKGWGGILTNDTFFGFFKEEGKANLVSGGRYRPLSLLLFATVWQISGDSPMVFHLANVLLYILCCYLVYLCLRAFLKPILGKRYSDDIPFLGSLFFICHPIHTEVVANIKGADEILAMLFVLVAWLFFMRPPHKNKLIVNLAILTSALLAFLSKENAVTFLLVIPVSLAFLPGWQKKDVIRTWPLFAAFLIYLAIRFSVLGLAGAGEPPKELMNNPFIKIEGASYVPFEAGEKMATISYTLVEYLRLLVFPHPLVHDYYPRHVPIMDFSQPLVWIAILVYSFLILVSLKGLKDKNLFGWCAFYYLATLSIFTNILFPVGTNMSERFLFMPSLAFCLALSLLLSRGLRIEKKRVGALGLTAIILCFYCYKTIDRNTAWKNNFTLFTTDVKVAKQSAKLRNAVAGVLMDQPFEAEDFERQRAIAAAEAEGHLKVALNIHPNYKNASLLMGNSLYYQKKYEEAEQYYVRTLKIDPGFIDANRNLFLTYREGGKYFGEVKGDVLKAISWLEKAENLNSQDYEVNRLLGVAYGLSGNPESALKHFDAAARIQPKNALAWLNLGKAHMNLGQADQGTSCFEKARQLDPDVMNK